MKPIRAKADLWERSRAPIGGLAALLLCGMFASQARAEMLVSETTLVSGTQSSVFTFTAPGPGTITVELSDVAWPQPLDAMSFLATSANKVLATMATSSVDGILSTGSPRGSEVDSFQLVSGGKYFADVSATAGGALDLGVYSLSILFKPAIAPVPLPASGGLLLGGCLALIALVRARRKQASTGSPTPGAALMTVSWTKLPREGAGAHALIVIRQQLPPPAEAA